MSYAPLNTEFAGQFVNVETGKTFEWADDAADFGAPFGDEFGSRVFVGPNAESFRFARVLKTVAYVVVDEDADGQPVVEKWTVRRRFTV